MSVVSRPWVRPLYHTESLSPPWRPVTDALLRDKINGTLCMCELKAAFIDMKPDNKTPDPKQWSLQCTHTILFLHLHLHLYWRTEELYSRQPAVYAQDSIPALTLTLIVTYWGAVLTSACSVRTGFYSCTYTYTYNDVLKNCTHVSLQHVVVLFLSTKGLLQHSYVSLVVLVLLLQCLHLGTHRQDLLVSPLDLRAEFI